MFKIHPEIPEALSTDARAFILSCFEPDPHKRATAAELLKEGFLRQVNKGKKNRIAFKPAGEVHPDSWGAALEAWAPLLFSERAALDFLTGTGSLPGDSGTLLVKVFPLGLCQGGRPEVPWLGFGVFSTAEPGLSAVRPPTLVRGGTSGDLPAAAALQATEAK